MGRYRIVPKRRDPTKRPTREVSREEVEAEIARRIELESRPTLRVPMAEIVAAALDREAAEREGRR